MVDGYPWHLPRQGAPAVECWHVQSTSGYQHIGIPGSTAAALCIHDDRQSTLGSDSQHPVYLAVVEVALCAGEHRVVIDYQRCQGSAGPEQIAVHQSCCGNDAVGRCLLLQFFYAAAAALCRDCKLAVFIDRRALDQVLQVFPGGATAVVVALRHGHGSGLVPGFVSAPGKVIESFGVHGLLLLGSADHSR